MEKGIVKWFDPAKGFGFIVPKAGGQDVYVHARVLEKAAITELGANSLVNYTAINKSGRVYVDEISIVTQPPATTRTPTKPIVAAKATVDRDLEDDFEREWGLRRA